MTDMPSRERGQTDHSDHSAQPGRRRRWLAWGAAVLLCLVTGLLVSHEARTSRLQAWALERYAAPLGFELAPGPSDQIRFPAHGPFNERLGYTRIPVFVDRLQARDFEVTAQARHNQALRAYLDRGLYAPYREKTQTGLTVFDCHRIPIHRFGYPYRQFDDLSSVPPVVAQALLFIENRDLLDADRPQLNPAVDWVRFTRAVLGQVGNRLHAEFDTPGGSTLSTQIEKYR
ncbi:MAG: glycosyl transferase family 51, partial [Comamonadaceae bacterium]|nr:glycosyl transferase family 51 [Comamonadaceae bacterium]